MQQETLRWVVQNMSTWRAICRAGEFEFTGEEVLAAYKMLLEKSKSNTDFDTLFMVFLTEYEKEIPFLDSGEEEEDGE